MANANSGKSRNFIDTCDRLDESFRHAIALADALKMLSAVEMDGDLTPLGHILRSDTMPVLAVLLTRLLEQMKEDSNATRVPVEMRREGAAAH